MSYREILTEDELVQALLTGEVPQNRCVHLRTLLEEAPEILLKGLVEQVSRQSKPGEVEKNVLKIADALQASRRVRDWLTTA